jgi:hypothetical protein
MVIMENKADSRRNANKLNPNNLKLAAIDQKLNGGFRLE